MPEIITAVYENGVLRPVNSVSLKEGETVRLKIVPEVAPGGQKTDMDKAFQILVDEGVISLPPKYGQVDPAELARREQNRKLVKIEGKPLSETIIEDRGPW
ncbi:MAG TPA: antitoxin family protein [Kamptonema sp.]|nr:antitoxin family protein [Kamptonema sp.]